MAASSFCWYELMTSAPQAAETFYDAVVGWTSQDSGMEGAMPYTLFSTAGGPQVAGLMGLPPEPVARAVPPHWSGYLAVPDVDAGAASVERAGGRLLRAPEDIPGIGRFAVVADPQGASIVLFKGQGEAPPASAPGTAGTVGWHELVTSDAKAAWTFYAGLFGWTDAGAIDMGGAGSYQMFAIDGVPSGGIMNRPAQAPGGPAWGYYINIPEIHSAVERVLAHGGRVVQGPVQVPGGSWIVNAVDPQGAFFSLVGPGTPV